ncbi:MAG: PQQ-binding-like beta-propeller repeat protein [Armatimonadetes bacterium]|nr:PQQ-binding-like beta-propeller repeat protein [Armatimonadota bacterium]
MLKNDVDKIKSLEESAKVGCQSAMRGMWIAGIFCILVLGLLVGNRDATWSANPQNSAPLKAMQVRLAKAPTNESLKNEIRQLDAQLRHEYLFRLTFANQGSYVLLLGVVLFLIAGASAAAYNKKIPMPGLEEQSSDSVRRSAGVARRSVGVFGVIAALSLMVIVVSSQGNLNSEYRKAVRGYHGQAAESGQVNAASQAVQSALAPATPMPAPAAGNPPISSSKITIGPFSPPQIQLVKNTQTGNKKPIASKIETVALDESDYQPVAEEWAKNWPVFRGPTGMGVIESGDYPLKWDGKSGEGIIWKTAIPLPGWNSPVVWGDKIFVVGADKTKREIYCIDAASGKIIWKQPFAMIAKQADVMEDTGYAPSTLAVDGKRIFAIFPNGDLGCFDFEGKQIWAKSLGVPENTYGHGSSLTMFRSLLMILFDQGSGGSDGKSIFYALQGGTGNIVWYAKRPVANSWATPVVATIGGRLEMLTNANPYVISYDPLTGKEYWRADVMSGDVVPSPIVAGGMALSCNTGAYLAAIKPGSGDLSKTGIAWKASDGLPDISSPVANNDLVFLADSMGNVTCVDVKTGKKVWEHAYETAFKASPSIVVGNVYLLDSEGVMRVIAAGRTFKEVSKSALSEGASATPAFVGGRIYIRGDKSLYCIGKK